MRGHNHIAQSARGPVPGCPACGRIRVEVMKANPSMIRGGMFGWAPREENER